MDGIRLGCRVLAHQPFRIRVLGGLDLIDLGVDCLLGGAGAELLFRGSLGPVGIMQVVGHGLEIGVQVLDHFVGLQRFGIVLSQLLQLFLLVFRGDWSIYSARDMSRFCLGGLAGRDQYVVQVIHLLCPEWSRERDKSVCRFQGEFGR